MYSVKLNFANLIFTNGTDHENREKFHDHEHFQSYSIMFLVSRLNFTCSLTQEHRLIKNCENKIHMHGL